MTTCPCCLATNAEEALVVDRYQHEWWLSLCEGCGVEYQAAPMPDEVRKEFYASGRYRQLCEQATGKPWTDRTYLEQAQRAYAVLWHYSEGKPRLNSGTWLDFGGSTGVVSSIWKGHADSVFVADYGDIGLSVNQRTFIEPEQAWLRHYETILCCQTLDHLREPLKTLQQFKTVAHPKARLFVDVVKRAHTAYKIDHDVYFPTAHSFVSLVERAGWSVVWLDCETHSTHYSILAEVA